MVRAAKGLPASNLPLAFHVLETREPGCCPSRVFCVLLAIETPMAITWPLQKDCDAFYGDPRGADGPSAKFEARLVSVPCPWILRYEGKPVRGLRVHKNCAESLARVLDAIWGRFGRDQAEIDRVGMSIYGGGYNYRLKRGGNSLSMHSYGCAVDFDPERNALGNSRPTMDRRVVECFEAEGWEWGGHWSTKDGMHFQAARTRAVPLRLHPVAPTTADRDDVVAVQKRLRALGYPEAGMPNGDWGTRTVGALAAFQAHEGLPVTGQLDQDTRASLARATPRPVSAERQALTPQTLRATVPAAGKAFLARVLATIMWVCGLIYTAIMWVVDYFGVVSSKIAPLQQMLSDVPKPVWVAAIVGLAIALGLAASGAEKAVVASVKSGETAGPDMSPAPEGG